MCRFDDNEMKIETDDDRLILIAAFSYALGRMSCIPSVVAEVIRGCWSDLTNSDKMLIKREIKEAVDRGSAGMSCDVNAWNKILELGN